MRNKKQIQSCMTWIVWPKSLECTRTANLNTGNVTVVKVWWHALNGIRADVIHLSP